MQAAVREEPIEEALADLSGMTCTPPSWYSGSVQHQLRVVDVTGFVIEEARREEWPLIR